MRINMSLVDICILGTWIAYKISTGIEETQDDFYLELVEEMIDNMYDQPNSARNQNSGYDTPNQ